MAAAGRHHLRLRDGCATARAFTFKEPFAADGEVYVVDRQRFRSITEANSSGWQTDLLAHVQSLKV